MTTKEKIIRVEYLFHQMILFNKNEFESELLKLLEELIVEMSQKFDEPEQNIRLEMLSLCEKFTLNFFTSMIVLIGNYINSFERERIVGSYKFEYKKYDVDEINSKFMLIMDESFKRNNKIRLLDYVIQYQLSEVEQKALLFHTLDLFTEATKKIDLDDSDIRIIYYNAALIRRLSLDLERLDHFYFALAVMIDRFTQSQQFQLARDLAEEALIISKKDNLLYWGYFIQFKVFNIQFIPAEASLYLLCSIVNSQKHILSNEYFINLLINSHRFFRNVRLVPFAESIFKTIISLPTLSEFDLESITCSHFNLMMSIRKPELILAIYNFLNEHRESIINNDKISAVPWINLLYNCSVVYKNDPDLSLLEDYKMIFENIVGKEDAERYKAYSFGESERIVEYFIESLVAHNETRDKNDLAGEVHNSLVLANRLSYYSYKNNNTNAFLLSMILKSDHSLIFKGKDIINPLREIHTIKKNQQSFIEYYNYYNTVRTFLSNFPETEFIWFASVDLDVFILKFIDGEFTRIDKINNYSLLKQQEWLNGKTNLLTFNDTIKVADQILPYPEENQKNDLRIFIDSLEFTRVQTMEKKSVCIFRDIELSELPHNLLLNSNNKFILENSYLIDTVSFELLKEFNFDFNFPKDLKIKMWIPINDGDFTLNLLYSKLENILSNNNIEVITSSIPPNPIKSNVTILVAHGDKRISGFPSMYTYSEKAITDIENIIEDTDILILFVCYSGSGERAILKSNLNSFVRKLLASGIKTIIAPFWALHISIPPIWLPAFLTSLSQGESVGNAFRIANLEVYSMNKNPAAWCCLHCYGNPFIKLEQ